MNVTTPRDRRTRPVNRKFQFDQLKKSRDCVGECKQSRDLRHHVFIVTSASSVRCKDACVKIFSMIMNFNRNYFGLKKIHLLLPLLLVWLLMTSRTRGLNWNIFCLTFFERLLKYFEISFWIISCPYIWRQNRHIVTSLLMFVKKINQCSFVNVTVC